MTTPIADEVARMHPDARSGNESDNPFSREQAMLAAAGAPTGIASVGSTLPDAQLLDPFANPMTPQRSPRREGRRARALPGRVVSSCNLTLSTYKEHLFPQLQDQTFTRAQSGTG